MLLLLAFLLAMPGALGAIPAPVALPTGILLARSEDASYEVEPDGSILPQRGLLSYYPEGSEPLWPVVDAPGWVVQGRMFTVLVAVRGALAEVRATVSAVPTRAAAAGRGFELPWEDAPTGSESPPALPTVAAPDAAPAEERPRVYAILLALPSDGEATPCVLHVQGTAGDRSFDYVSRLDVFPYEAREARIALDSTLTALRTRTDARVVRDQERLDEVLALFEPTAIYDTGPLRLPVQGGSLSATFGDRRIYQYSNGSTARSVHNGLDIAIAAGTKVYACARGRVVLAEELVETGNTVAVEHLPGVVSFYFHLSAFDVAVDKLVEAGELIGRVGATGLATGPHLHWEVRCGGVPVDPVFATTRAMVDKAAVVRIIVACQSR